MSISKTLWGTTYIIPETDEVDWGDQVTALLSELATRLNLILGLTASDNLTLKLSSTTNSTLTAGSTLTPATMVHNLTGSPGAVTLSAVTAIANGNTGGQLLILRGAHATQFVTILHGANTQMNGDCTLELHDILALYYDTSVGDWIELFRSS